MSGPVQSSDARVKTLYQRAPRYRLKDLGIHTAVAILSRDGISRRFRLHDLSQSGAGICDAPHPWLEPGMCAEAVIELSGQALYSGAVQVVARRTAGLEVLVGLAFTEGQLSVDVLLMMGLVIRRLPMHRLPFAMPLTAAQELGEARYYPLVRQLAAFLVESRRFLAGLELQLGWDGLESQERRLLRVLLRQHLTAAWVPALVRCFVDIDQAYRELEEPQRMPSLHYAREQLLAQLAPAPIIELACAPLAPHSKRMKLRQLLTAKDPPGASLSAFALELGLTSHPAFFALRARPAMIQQAVTAWLIGQQHLRHIRSAVLVPECVDSCLFPLSDSERTQLKSLELTLICADPSILNAAQHRCLQLLHGEWRGRLRIWYQEERVERLLSRGGGVLPGGPFELVVCQNVLEYASHAECGRFISTLYRSLVPGGKAILGLWLTDQTAHWLGHVLLDWRPTEWSRESLEALIRSEHPEAELCWRHGSVGFLPLLELGRPAG